MEVLTRFLLLISVGLAVASNYNDNNNYRYGYGDDLTVYQEGKEYIVDQYIKRPCPKMNAECVRQFFAEKHLCVPLEKPGPEPYPFDNLPLELPHGNTTYVWKNAIAKGLREYEIKELYVNERTNRLVLEVEFEGLVLQSPKSFAVFHMKGKEPVITGDYFSITHRNLSLTLVISNYRSHPRTHVYVYRNEPQPVYVLGPQFIPQDPEALVNYLQLVGNFRLTLDEGFVNQGPVIMSMFFQSSLACDLRFSHVQY